MNKIKNQYGFTLTEIISVFGLALVITLIMYNIFLLSQDSFGVGDKHLEISQNGRVFFDRLSRELRQTPEIVTGLPATKDVIGFPPAEEIEFQDGHDIETIEYIRYYLDGNLVKRQRKKYYFAADPDTSVYWNVKDEFGEDPLSQILEERTIAEYINQLNFYGSSITYLEAWLAKHDVDLHLYTGVWGRNTRL